MAYSGDITVKKVDLGNSIAFNAKKKGSLEYVDLTKCLNGTSTVSSIYKGMCISEYDEERIYGDPNKASKMIASNYTPVYYNNLKALQIGTGANLDPHFSLTYFNKLVNKTDPDFVQLLARSSKLTSVCISQANLSKQFADILVLALDPKRAEFFSKIKVLDLSRNNLGKEGMKTFAGILVNNNII